MSNLEITESVERRTQYLINILYYINLVICIIVLTIGAFTLFEDPSYIALAYCNCNLFVLANFT